MEGGGKEREREGIGGERRGEGQYGVEALAVAMLAASGRGKCGEGVGGGERSAGNNRV